MKKNIIVVMGATGAQGGGLARAILNDPNSEFTVRAVTRNPKSEKAQELSRMGAEVVTANLDDKESVKRAMNGAYGAFCVTFYWEHFSPEKEFNEVKNMAEAAKEAGLKHVIWSTLENTRTFIPLTDNRMPTLMGKYKVPHFDAKGEANQLFLDLGVPTTFLLASFYWENLINFGMGPHRDAEGKLVISFPLGDTKWPGIASGDIGKCAYGIFKRGNEMIGKTIGIAGQHHTCQDMANALTRALGEEVRYNEMTPEMYRQLGFPGAEDLGNMFQFMRDFDVYFNRIRKVEFSRELNPELKNFDQWLAENAKHIPVEKVSKNKKAA